MAQASTTPTLPLPHMINTATLSPVLREMLTLLLHHRAQLDDRVRTVVLATHGTQWTLKVTRELQLEG
jgi:hypothetical protein